MDWNRDTFSILYNNQNIEVDTVCEDKNMKFGVHLPEEDIILEMMWDKDKEMDYWQEIGKGETELAAQLGELIECCSEHK